MGYKQEQEDIESYFNTEFTAVNPAVPIFWSNTPISAQEPPYVELSIVDGDARQASMGGGPNVYRNQGIIVCKLYGVLNEGEGNMRVLVDQITAIFRSKRFSGITTFAPRPDILGEIDGAYRVNVLTAFQRDELV